MAQQTVVQSTCDKCGVTAISEIVDGRAKLQLPDSWTNVAIRSKNTDLFDKDLCDSCTTQLLPILGINTKHQKGNIK